ncbi:MAG: hemolysin [Ignavibacteria bacterium]|nr:hemolysin [Ignavibacteria bacterium]
MFYNILLTLFFVALNAFFVAAEFALVKIRASQLEIRIRAGSSFAKITKELISRLDTCLSGCQLGITLASLGLGWIGESVVGEIIMTILGYFNINLSPQTAHTISLPTAFVVITVLHIILGELAPKSVAMSSPEKTSMFVALPLRLFLFVFKPIIWALNSLSILILKLFGIEIISGEVNLHSAEELRYLLEESTKSGELEISEHKLLENVFEFSDIPIKRIMVPHIKIVGIELSMSSQKIIELFIQEGYSRMPVYEKSIDNIIGVVYAKDLIAMLNNKHLIIVQDIIRPVVFVQENEKIDKLLSLFQKKRIHIAVVLDEFGQTAGIVTLEDVIEEIVGEIQDEYDEETPAVEQLGNNEFSVRASASIDDVNDLLPVELPSGEDYETVGGLIMNLVSRIPEANEVVPIPGYNCKIIKRSKRNLELVKLTLLQSRLDEKSEE